MESTTNDTLDTQKTTSSDNSPFRSSSERSSERRSYPYEDSSHGDYGYDSSMAYSQEATPPRPSSIPNGQYSSNKSDPYSFSEEELCSPNSGAPVNSGQPQRASFPNSSNEVSRILKEEEDGDEDEDDDDEDDLPEDEDEDSSEGKCVESSAGDTSGADNDLLCGDDEDRLIIAEEDNTFLSIKKEMKPPRKKQNRFNGMTEEEISKKILPDLISNDLDILIIGINPGMYAAYKGHHYAGPGNHFWKCMFLSGLLPHSMSADDDYKLLDYGIGFTNIVERTTRGSACLTRKEVEEGVVVLLDKIRKYRPKIAVFNGKGIYEVFSGSKNFYFGKQPEFIEGTKTSVWVMPNSSARCAQLPRAIDKVPFYASLKKYRDFRTGVITKPLSEDELVFKDEKLLNCNEGSLIKRSGGDILLTDYGSLPEDDRIDPITGKKRRGRPPKSREGTMPPPPKRRATDEEGRPIQRGSNPIDPLTGKKKRGRPKKSDQMNGTSPLPTVVKSKKLRKEDIESLKLNHRHPLTPLPPFSPNFSRMVDKEQQQEEEESERERERESRKKPKEVVYSESQHYEDDYYSNYPQSVKQPSSNIHLSFDAYSGCYGNNSYDRKGTSANNGNGGVGIGGSVGIGGVGGGGSGVLVTNSDNDVTTKSITGLESLVDQIPALENDSGVFSGASGSSHPNTPRSVGPYSPTSSSEHRTPFFPGFSGGSNNFSTSAPTGGGDSFPPSDSSSTNYSSSSAAAVTPTNFSVSSLVHQCGSDSPTPSSPAHEGGLMPPPHPSDSFSVSSLTGTYNNEMANKYHGLSSNAPSNNHPYMSGNMFSSSSSGNSSFGSAPGGFGSFMGAAGAMAGMSHMGYYSQYHPSQYGGSGFGTAYPPHGLHVPNPSYPYPSPYGQSPYSQSPYF